MIQRYGVAGMYRRVSETARYGGLTRGPMVMNKEKQRTNEKGSRTNQGWYLQRRVD